MTRHDSHAANVRAKKQELALKAISSGATIAAAATAAGVDRHTLWAWRRDDADFGERWLHALERRAEAFEDLAQSFVERALAPGAEPALASAGVRLLLRMLAADRPQRWSERRQVEHSAGADVPTPERLAELRSATQSDEWHQHAAAMAETLRRKEA